MICELGWWRLIADTKINVNELQKMKTASLLGLVTSTNKAFTFFCNTNHDDKPDLFDKDTSYYIDLVVKEIQQEINHLHGRVQGLVRRERERERELLFWNVLQHSRRSYPKVRGRDGRHAEMGH